MRSAICAVVGLLILMSTGCTVHHHCGRPFAYGVRTDDWVIEEQAQNCATTCDSKVGEAHLLCLSHCPAFVTAPVATCRDVPEWDTCTIGYDSTTTYGDPVRNRNSRTGEKVALGTLRLLGSVATGLLEASLEDDDKDEDKKQAKREKQAKHPKGAAKKHRAKRSVKPADKKKHWPPRPR